MSGKQRGHGMGVGSDVGTLEQQTPREAQPLLGGVRGEASGASPPWSIDRFLVRLPLPEADEALHQGRRTLTEAYALYERLRQRYADSVGGRKRPVRPGGRGRAPS